MVGDIQRHTEEYEAWLGARIPLVAEDLALKHERMASGAFPFMRATFYHWLRVWQSACEELQDAPSVLAIGDVHVENFGTWRDAEGRLIWGANDFDECVPLPYTQDLVRLAVSATLAIAEHKLDIDSEGAADAILDGYTQAIEEGGTPFVLAERHERLRKIALGNLRDPVRFWEKLERLPTWEAPLSADLDAGLRSMLPRAELELRVARRIAGIGSLGRQRFVAIAEWRGGKIAREAKALAPSAWWWAMGGASTPKIHFADLLESAVRAPDPFMRIVPGWTLRRLAPDCARVELAELPKDRDEKRLLFTMGYEVANVHLGSSDAKKEVAGDLRRRPARWLSESARDMTKLVLRDFEDWKTSPSVTAEKTQPARTKKR